MFNQFEKVIRFIDHYLKFQKKTYATISTNIIVPYYEDSSNSDNKYVRNDIRNRLIPAIDQNNQLDSIAFIKIETLA